MKNSIINILFVVIAGAVLPIQAGLNIQLGKSVHQPVFSAFASFLIGTIALLLYLLFLKFDFSLISNTRAITPWVWLAGLLGAFYVTVVIVFTPRLGVALTFALVVAGQMTISLLLDHYGLFDLPIRHINWKRVLGVMFLITGVLLIRKY